MGMRMPQMVIDTLSMKMHKSDGNAIVVGGQIKNSTKGLPKKTQMIHKRRTTSRQKQKTTGIQPEKQTTDVRLMENFMT
jgi:hypothetical protein